MNHPLHWPAGWPRTRNPARARFGDTTITTEIRFLDGELQRLRARGVVLSTNLPVRLDGLPRSGAARPQDAGVAVYFTLKAQPHVLACDRWDRVEHNIRAIAKHIEALRGIDRWGVGTIEQAFTGYAALPPPTSSLPHEVLGVPVTASAAEIRAAFRSRVKEGHPDRGGRADIGALVEAREQLLKGEAWRKEGGDASQT